MPPSSPLPWLDPTPVAFPPLETALDDPNGLLAAGGSLSPEWLLHAYSRGIFPWFEEGQPTLWWSPDPRLVLFPDRVRVSRSLRKLLRSNPYQLRMDTAFESVIHQCGPGRDHSGDTWITTEMKSAYLLMHETGHAHSVEVWDKAELVGGLYGIAIGKVFFGESMFSSKANASKIALVALAQQLEKWQFAIIDCQVSSDHLFTMGAEEIDRDSFVQYLHKYTRLPHATGPWKFDSDFVLAAHAI